MNLDQVANKYGINRNSLNAKDDAIKIAIKSIQDLVKGMEHKKVDTEFVDAVKKLGNFLYDVSDSTIG
jgi:CheY-specific phosphatase CheX